MRSTNEIIIAVQDCLPCTDEELRLCIMSLKARLHFAEHDMDELSAAVTAGKPFAKMRAGFWERDREMRFQSMKKPVEEYLGPANTPGTPEYTQRMAGARALFKKATGINL